MAERKGSRGRGRSTTRAPAPGADVRRLAIEAVRRIADEGAYANLLVPSLLDDSTLDQRDRNLVTEIVYGATRMQRALDWLADRYLTTPPPPALRAALRVGAYQLAFMRIPAHAAVSTTVEASAKRNRGVVNAILRRIAEGLPVEWPNDGVRLSYPDWIIERMGADLGPRAAMGALDAMNAAPVVHQRDDGYVQDLASKWVTDIVDAQAGERVLDLCAAPGGKATAMAGTGAFVVAVDRRHGRSGLVRENARSLGLTDIATVTADGTAAPFPGAVFDRVLVDAPCSGLGVLRRRPDARWRVAATDVDALADLQRRLLDAAATLVRPGGVLVYSVCTLTDAETVDVATAFTAAAAVDPEPIVDDRWSPHGPGGRVLPQDHDTDGMAVFRWRVRADAAATGGVDR